jgi:hypothetical protein
MTLRVRRLERLRQQAAADDPIVAKVLAAFRGAEVLEVLDAAPTPIPPAAIASQNVTLEKEQP